MQAVAQLQISAHSEPLPHPEILRQYEEIVPGSAARIILQSEQQAAHRRQMESTVIQSNPFSQSLGVVSASLIGLLGVGGGVWLAYAGRDLSGLASVFGTLGSLLTVFFVSKNRQTAELASKRQDSTRSALS